MIEETEASLFCLPFFRLGCECWKQHWAQSQGEPAESELVIEALRKARDLMQCVDVFDRGLSEVYELLNRPDRAAALRHGHFDDLLREVDQLLRNRGDPLRWAWWQLGVQLSGLDLAPSEAPAAEIDRMLAKTQSLLQRCGVPDADLYRIIATRQDRVTAMNEWLEARCALPANLDLMRLRVQHGRGAFPEVELLSRLRVTPSGLELLRLIYVRRPLPVPSSSICRELGVSSNAVLQRLQQIPLEVREALLVDSDGRKVKAWRTARPMS